MKATHIPPDRTTLPPCLGRCGPWIAGLVVWLGAASASASEAHLYQEWRPDQFLRSWQILGPIPVTPTGTPDETVRRKAFDEDLLASIGGESGVDPKSEARLTLPGTQLTWQAVTAASGVVDLGTVLGTRDDVVAYAYAEINLPEAARATLGVGSDDGVRVWVNGTLVHQNWTGRAAVPDSDLVPVDLKQGRNRLLIKVQNMQGPWGFACRRMGSEALGNRLMAATHAGDLDQVRQLADLGTDLNYRVRGGVTASVVARLRGEQDILRFLEQRGVDVSLPLPDPGSLVEARFAGLFKPDGPGAAVLVARGGKVLFEKGYGLADIGHGIPVTPETRFRIGSITKQFTSAAILRLQREGRLSLTNTLSQFVPGFPRGEGVTLEHLLTHTSGIHSYTSKPDFLETVMLGVETEAHIRSFQNDPYDFEPGERWLYNNSGYFLLGYIVEKASGQSFGDYLRTTFLEPLGMQATGVHGPRGILPHEARGYSFEGGRLQKALDWDMSRAGAAGALYSTVGDLYRWNEAVFGGQVLDSDSLRAAFTPVKTRQDAPTEAGPKETGYGYGWAIEKFRGLQEISHGGGLQGFVSFLLRMPKEDFTVVVLVNCAPPPPGVDPGGLAHEVAEFYLSDVLAPRTKPPIDRTVVGNALAALVGRYDYGGVFMEITRDGDRLFAQLPGQPKHEIFPKSSTNFFWKVVEAEVTFLKDPQGVVTGAIHRQGGQTLRAPRVPDLASVTVDTAKLESYTGRYDYGGGKAILTVTREGDRLFAQMTGQPRFEVFAKSETEFHWKVTAAQVTFVRGPSGDVTHLIHQQAGSRIEAPRMP